MLLPLEVLEAIAFWVATEDASITPLSNLISLLLLDRETNKFLSSDSLYARIYGTKFDIKTTTRRLGKERLTARGLAAELKKRCVHLRAIRNASLDPELIEQAVWTAFVMVLENDEKNERQLLEYAHMTHWLKRRWIGISMTFRGGDWPPNSLTNSVCMWLLCNFYSKGNYYQRETLGMLANAMKLFSVGAHHYPISHLSWTDYTPREDAKAPPHHEITLYGERVKLTPLPIAVPATISYLGIAETLGNKNHLPALSGNPGDTEWNRVFGLIGNDLSKVHTVGSLEGVWEGAFTYTDFTAYNTFLRGSSSDVVVHTRHRQTFRAREYVVFDSTILRVGDSLDAFLPEKPIINKTPSGIEIEGIEYLAFADLTEEQKEGRTVQDVIIFGEGHSSWGQFRILGRIRPYDGLFSLLKDYTEDDRGTWLYRGYLVGDAGATMVGRWRDTFSPPDFLGYEGSFMMTRRS